MTAPVAASRPPRSILLGVLLISGCVLALEVALTRIFSAVLRYHFVFLVVSVAVCGLGVGGMLTHGIARLRRLSLSTTASGLGFSSLAFIVVLFKLILAHFPDALLLIALLILVPFVFAGMFLAIAFFRHPESSGLLYAYDLCGAACASIGVVVAMQWLGALNAYLATSLVACIAGFVDRRQAARVIGVVVTSIALVTNLRFNWLDIPPIDSHRDDYAKPLYAELADKSVGSKIVHSEWDAFARTDVVEDPQAGKDVLLVYTNGHVPTDILRYDWDKKQYALMPVVAEVPFQWRPPERVLCIGPGAGLDLILAHKWGAKKIDGVEVNPAIPRILRMERFQKFGGDPYHLPGVNVIVGDGRTFVLRARAQYDLIFTALTKTATSSGGMALVEGYIYTLEAFEAYWRRLSPNGQLVFVTDGYVATVRLFNTAIAMLTKEGLRLSDALDYVALLRVPDQLMGTTPYQFALIVSHAPITSQDGERLFRTTYRAGYQELFIPGDSEREPFRDLRRDGASLQTFAERVSHELQQDLPAAQRQPLNLMPVTDDTPFFQDFMFTIPSILLPLLLITVSVVVVFAAFVVVKRVRGGGDPSPLSTVMSMAYFACLGVGFMMIEIPLMQKLILVLGHPTLALTVVLFALLLGGGIGSGLSQRVALAGLPIVCACVAATAAACAFYLRAPQSSILALPLYARIGWAGALSGALGVALGMPFPMGLRALGRERSEEIPAMWGLNGLTSVLGSLFAAVGAKMLGFQCVFLGGIGCYLLAGLLRSAVARAEQPTAPSAEQCPA